MRFCLVNHLLNLRLGHVLAEFGGDALQILKCDVVLLLGKQDESFLQLLLAVPLRHLRRHYVHKVVQVNRDHAFLVFVAVAVVSVIRELRNQTFDFLLCGLEAEGAQGHAQVLQCDVAVRIRVEQVESLLDVRLLLVSELLSELTASLFASRCGSACGAYVLARQRQHLRCCPVSCLCL